MSGKILPLTLAGLACQCGPSDTVGPGSAAGAAEPGSPVRVENMEVRIARWHDGKKAAISVQFEGSDPSLLARALPAVRRYGRQPFVGTFLPDRESEAYRARREEWESAIRDGRQELGRADVKAPRVLTVGSDPERADIVGLDAFKQRVDESVAGGGWTSFSFHSVGQETGLSVGDEDFRQMMNYLSMRRYYWQAWIGGVSQVHKYQVERDAIRVSVEAVSPSKIKIEVECGTDPKAYDQPLTLQVDFRHLWRDYQFDVEVLDGSGKRIPALRRSDLGPPLFVHVPPQRGTYYVQVTDPRVGARPLPDESARSVGDPASGLGASVCRWHDGRQAAVSFRFDDSYATHILKAIPMLREYGYKGTFFINPASSGYRDHRAEWEAVAARGDQEFANHTMRHNGALNDEEADREVGDVSRYIWSLFPGKSKLLSFDTGGGTVWTFSQPFRALADRYHLFWPHPRTSIGMTDKDAENYRARLAGAIERKVWFSANFHSIALPWMSDETFRRVLEATKERESEIWVAGIAEAFKYEQERNASTLALHRGEGDTLVLTLACGTDRELYDQPLTIELALPEGWSAATLKVRDAQGKAVATRAATVEGRPVVRFDVAPVEGEYAITR
ncbi:MAG: polysaccharide deacetylase family protein [Armatimonadetes bacterium]|nr:polysaccharide deacetylase family protein [Armatimonadota bacterium]